MPLPEEINTDHLPQFLLFKRDGLDYVGTTIALMAINHTHAIYCCANEGTGVCLEIRILPPVTKGGDRILDLPTDVFIEEYEVHSATYHSSRKLPDGINDLSMPKVDPDNPYAPVDAEFNPRASLDLTINDRTSPFGMQDDMPPMGESEVNDIEDVDAEETILDSNPESAEGTSNAHPDITCPRCGTSNVCEHPESFDVIQRYMCLNKQCRCVTFTADGETVPPDAEINPDDLAELMVPGPSEAVDPEYTQEGDPVITCPRCGTSTTYKHDKSPDGKQRYRCPKCHSYTTVTSMPDDEPDAEPVRVNSWWRNLVYIVTGK